MAGLMADKTGYNKVPAKISLFSLSATTKRKKIISQRGRDYRPLRVPKSRIMLPESRLRMFCGFPTFEVFSSCLYQIILFHNKVLFNCYCLQSHITPADL